LGKRFYVDQSYVLIDKDSISDSSLELFSSIYLEEKKYKFQQSASDEFFGDSFVSQEINDKILLNSLNLHAGLIYNSDIFGKINLGLRYVSDNYSLENYQIDQYIDNTQSINSKTTFITAEYLKTFSKIELNAKTENFIFGDNKSNMFSSSIMLQLKNNNSFTANYKLFSSVPNYNFLLHRSNYENYNWNNQFDNTITNSISLGLKLNEIIALGPSMSVLMEGYQDGYGVTSLKGTIVPAKTLNKIISKIPLIGKIVIPKEVGEGLFGISFKMKGPKDGIKTTINPIRTLTPRFIQKIVEKKKVTE